MVTETTKTSALIDEKYPQGDLFICDVADAVLKDIMPQMEHPFYALSKKPDTSVRRYEHNGNWLEVVPSVKGLGDDLRQRHIDLLHLADHGENQRGRRCH